MPSVMSKFIAEKMGTRASKRRRQDGSLPTPPKQPVHLPGETIVEAALFLDRLDLDAVQFSSQRHRTIVRDNAHLIPLRDLARISFEHNSPEGRVRVWVQPMEHPTRPAAGIVQSIKFDGTWEEVLAAKDQFQDAVRYSVPRRLCLATPNMEWDHVRELFGDTPLTIRVSNEVIIDERVKPDIIGMQKFLRHFDLVNCIKVTEPRWNWHPNRLAAKCNDAFLRWCTENSLTQLELGERGAVLSAEAILDYCFGPDGSDSEPRHLKALFQCSADFISRLLEANRKCSRNGPITMDVMAETDDAPNVAELAPYRAEETRRRGFDVTTFLLPDDFDLKIVYSYRPADQWAASNCRIEVYRPTQPSQ